ncbi:MAG TPA: hypothetical protein PLC52_01400 [Anaerolineales bacterium]|mgnify:CR=1 FL=1|nr:hypothetical protein [Anaerolineales bacterium]HRQ91508.1 hypothetical protein [Anaerolineales bacterium]
MASKKQTLPEKPSNVNVIGVMNLVSGAVNILVGGGLTIGVVLGTFFVGIICLPITIAPVVLGIFEVLYGVKLMATPPQPVKPSKAIAIAQILSFVYLNVISGVIGILSLTMYTDPEVDAYFKALNPDEAA